MLSPHLSMHLHTFLWSHGYRSCSAVRGGGTMLFQPRVSILLLQKQVEEAVLETSRETAPLCSHAARIDQLWTIKDKTTLFFYGRQVSICHSKGSYFQKETFVDRETAANSGKLKPCSKKCKLQEGYDMLTLALHILTNLLMIIWSNITNPKWNFGSVRA